MEQTLVITEKPSVAQNIAKVLGANKRHDGYLFGNGWIVSWCVGHLVELAEPEDYDSTYKKWAKEDLPILLSKWKYNVFTATKKQFTVIKKLMAKDDISDLVYRVLVFACCDEVVSGELPKGKITPLAYILLSNPVRVSAAGTFAYFERNGVEVKVISGDTPLTVSEAAQEAGIKNAERCVDARMLNTSEDIDQVMREYTVFGRVTPEQKREFVRSLKAQGHTVAMTGDGVNDILALKDADCSVAMASGSEAAAHVAQMVLLDSDFSCMPDVVMEGRRVVNNIQNSSSLFLVKNIFSFFLALFSALLSITYPLEPKQLFLISFFLIGVPAFFLAFLRNKAEIKEHFLSNILFRSLPAGVTDVIVVLAVVFLGKWQNISSDEIATAATALLVMVSAIVLIQVCRPFRPVKVGICILCFAGVAAGSYYFPTLFGLVKMSGSCLLLLIPVMGGSDTAVVDPDKRREMAGRLVSKAVFAKIAWLNCAKSIT